MPDIDAALRRLVRVRAAGFCEYCRVSEGFTLAEHEVDHVIAVKHGGQTVSDNLALCCAVCNRFFSTPMNKKTLASSYRRSSAFIGGYPLVHHGHRWH